MKHCHSRVKKIQKILKFGTRTSCGSRILNMPLVFDIYYVFVDYSYNDDTHYCKKVVDPLLEAYYKSAYAFWHFVLCTDAKNHH